MTKLTILAVTLLSSFYCTSQEQKETNQEIIRIESSNTNEFTINDEAYTLHFELEKTINQNPTLVISIELHNDSYFISPLEKRDFKGKFYMDLGDYTHLDFKGNIVETRHSFEKFDTHQNVNDSNTNWVRVNTTYKQALQVKSLHEFEVFGRLRFTIEPRCTLEEIPFAISYKNGKYKITYPKC